MLLWLCSWHVRHVNCPKSLDTLWQVAQGAAWLPDVGNVETVECFQFVAHDVVDVWQLRQVVGNPAPVWESLGVL
jgi:hypothetical protein